MIRYFLIQYILWNHALAVHKARSLSCIQKSSVIPWWLNWRGNGQFAGIVLFRRNLSTRCIAIRHLGGNYILGNDCRGFISAKRGLFSLIKEIDKCHSWRPSDSKDMTCGEYRDQIYWILYPCTTKYALYPCEKRRGGGGAWLLLSCFSLLLEIIILSLSDFFAVLSRFFIWYYLYVKAY